MSTATLKDDRTTTENVERPEGGHMRGCSRCGIRYDWRKSTSGSLKMTYCGALCEIAGTGTTIETLLLASRSPGVQNGSTPSNI